MSSTINDFDLAVKAERQRIIDILLLSDMGFNGSSGTGLYGLLFAFAVNEDITPEDLLDAEKMVIGLIEETS